MLQKDVIQLVKMIDEDGDLSDRVLAKLDKSEKLVIYKIFEEFSQYGFSTLLSDLWLEDFYERPVSPEQFFTDDYYFGQVGSSLYDVWFDDLKNVLNPINGVNEWIIRGSIGGGKTFAGVCCLVYKIYFVTCLKDPSKYFSNIARGSPLVLGLFDVYQYLARSTSYNYLVTWLRDLSPYFKSLRPAREGKVESNKAVLTLPNNIKFAIGASAISALGQNILWGLMDEVEFGKKPADLEQMSQMSKLYTSVKSRIISRFQDTGGVNPGLMIMVSSPTSTDSFLEQHVEKTSTWENVYHSQYALYEIKHDTYKNSARFTVVLGDSVNKPYVLGEGGNDEIRLGAKVVDVPVDFIETFRHDIDNAIRDICGIPTHGTSRLFPNISKLMTCFKNSTPRQHPFTMEELEIGLDKRIKDENGELQFHPVGQSIEDYLIKERLVIMEDKINEIYKPIFFPNADRFIHIDLSKNHDCAGMTMGCISDTKVIKRHLQDGTVYPDHDHVFFVDFMIRVRAIKDSQIDFGKFRRFIFLLIDLFKFKVKRVTYDSYQSTDSIQILIKEGVESKEISLDRTTKPYYTLKSIVLEERLDVYEHTIVKDELEYLVDLLVNGRTKVDHLPKKSKDVSDSLAGMCFNALEMKGKPISGTAATGNYKRVQAVTEFMNKQDDPDSFVTADTTVKNKGHNLDDLF